MKTSGLTRFLAACLALISLSMLVSGVLGMRSAAKERRKNDAEIQDLQTKIDDYREISALLMDKDSYSDLNDDLEAQQKQYDNDASHHRTELATYSATNGGLQMGIEAMAQARAALSAGKMQYETIVKLLNKLQPILDVIEDLKNQIGVILEELGILRADLTLLPSEMEALEQRMEAFEAAGTNYLAVSAEEALQNLENMIPTENVDGEGDSIPEETDKGNTAEGDPSADLGGGENSGSNEQDAGAVKTGEESIDPGDAMGKPDPAPGEAESLDLTGDEPESGNEASLFTIDEFLPENSSANLPEATKSMDSTTNRSPQTGEDEVSVLSYAAGDLLEEIEWAESQSSAFGTVGADMEALMFSLYQVEETLTSLQSALNEMGVSPGTSLSELMGTDLRAMLESVLYSPADLDSGIYSALLGAISDGSAQEQIIGFKQGLGMISRESGTELSPEASNRLPGLMAQSTGYRYAIQASTGIVDEMPLQIYEIENRIYEMMNSLDSEEMSGGFGGLSLDSIDELGAQIEAGEAALAEGEAQLNATKEDQKKKAEELDREKRDLDLQEKRLKELTAQTEDQKAAEEREKGLRMALLSRSEIKRRTQYGDDLLSASETWLEEYTDQAENSYRDRFDSSILMIVCAILALAGAIASFGTKRNIAITVLATLLCQAFAFSAAFLLYRMGRGISWSALITAFLSTGLMASLIPGLPVKLHRAKKVRRRTAWKKIEN